MKPILVVGQKWRIGYGDPGRGRLGICNYERRELIIRPRLTLPETLGVILHETLHAAQPYLVEEAIEEIELSQMRAVKAMDILPSED